MNYDRERIQGRLFLATNTHGRAMDFDRADVTITNEWSDELDQYVRTVELHATITGETIVDPERVAKAPAGEIGDGA